MALNLKNTCSENYVLVYKIHIVVMMQTKGQHEQYCFDYGNALQHLIFFISNCKIKKCGLYIYPTSMCLALTVPKLFHR